MSGKQRKRHISSAKVSHMTWSYMRYVISGESETEMDRENISNTDLCEKFIRWLMPFSPFVGTTTKKSHWSNRFSFEQGKNVMLVLTRWTWYLLNSTAFHSVFFIRLFPSLHDEENIEIQETFSSYKYRIRRYWYLLLVFIATRCNDIFAECRIRGSYELF